MVEINLLEGVAEDDTVKLLRRAVKLLEASGNVDIGNRQRMTLDFITAGLTLAAVTTVTTVTTVTNVAATAGLDQRQFHETSRIAYNTGMRAALKFY
jgi:hypothetical protein